MNHREEVPAIENEREKNKHGRTAAAVVRIAQAAWTGGVHGAAAAAAAQAAPVLLKTALALILLFLCLPLLLLTAVPCNLFGAPSVDSADIQEMTAQAKALTAAWKQQRTLEQKAVDLFISLLPDDLDFIRIEKQLGNRIGDVKYDIFTPIRPNTLFQKIPKAIPDIPIGSRQGRRFITAAHLSDGAKRYSFPEWAECTAERAGNHPDSSVS